MAEPARPSSRPAVGLGRTCAALFVLAWQLLMRRPAAVAPERSYRQDNPDTAYETSDWPLAPIAYLYVGTVALLVICCFVLMLAYPNTLPDVSRDLRINPPGPRLQTSPESDLQSFQAEEERKLTTYYWTDKQKGTVHIPIAQAMEKLAATGIPGFPKGGP